MSPNPAHLAMSLNADEHEAFRRRVLEDKAFARGLFEEGMGLLRAGKLADAQEKLELALMPNSAHAAANPDNLNKAVFTTTTTTTPLKGVETVVNENPGPSLT